MILNELKQFNILTYKTSSAAFYFGKPYLVIDEDGVLRINDLFLIKKYGITSIEETKQTVDRINPWLSGQTW